MKSGLRALAVGVLGSALPGYRPIRFGFARTEPWIVSGFYVESSAFSAETFYVEAFAMPRFVPAEAVYFNYGFRVNDCWEEARLELAEAVAAAEPRLARIATFDGLLSQAADWRRNINHAELRLCTSVLNRDRRLYARTKRAALKITPEFEWEATVRDRCLSLAALIDDAGFAAAEAVLESRKETVDRVLG